jgi:hypothetical protein
MRAWRLTGAIALAAAVVPRAAGADGAPAKPTKDQCFDAYEQGQRLRKDGHLRAAREKLVACGAEACPAFVRQDCAKWLGDVEASTPTIVVLARRPDGNAVEDARATIDGEPLAERLDGRAVPVDPGPHDLRCEAGGTSTQSHIVVAEGAKNQAFYLTLGAPAPPAAPAEPAPARRRVPTASWVLGGVAVAGAISFTAFAIAGRSTQSCAPDCTRPQVDDLRRDYAVADASWITGLLAAGVAIYIAVAAPSPAPAARPTTAAIRW